MVNGIIYDGKGLEYPVPRGLSADHVPVDGQIIQILDGQLVPMDIEESAVAEFVESYIGTALEGEY